MMKMMKTMLTTTTITKTTGGNCVFIYQFTNTFTTTNTTFVIIITIEYIDSYHFEWMNDEYCLL